MKRFHIHLSVDSIEQSVGFYSRLFGAQPTVQKDDYAKWMLEEPRVNFAISAHGHATGLDHLGFQVESSDELHEMTGRLKSAGLALQDEGATTCCYAQSEKGWVHDPQGIAWENFVTTGSSTSYGTENAVATKGAACCAPTATSAPATAKPRVALKDIKINAATCGSGSTSASGCC